MSYIIIQTAAVFQSLGGLGLNEMSNFIQWYRLLDNYILAIFIN